VLANPAQADPPVLLRPIEDVEVDEDSGHTIIVDLDNIFADPDGRQIEFFFDNDPDDLNMGIDRNNTLFFNPVMDYHLPNGVEITVGAVNERGEASETQFTLTINPINDPPIVVNPIDDIVVEEDSGLFMLSDLNDVFSDIDGDMLNFSFVNDVDELNLEIDENNILFIDPDPDFSIEDGIDIIVRAEDPDGEFIIDIFHLTVLPVNDPPVVVQEIEDMEVDQDAGWVGIADLDDVFFDVDGDELFFGIADAPEELNMQIDNNNVLSFEADWDFHNENGMEITIIAEDNAGATAEDVFILVIIPVNIEDFWVNPIEDLIVNEDPGRVDIADLDEVFIFRNGRELMFMLAGAPEEINMDIDQNSVLFINPDENYNLPNGVEITVTAESEEGSIAEDNFILTIRSVNDAPIVINPIEDIIVEEDPGLVFIADLDDVFFDVDGDELFYLLENEVEEINFEIDEDNVIFFDPENNFNLEDGVDITVIAEDPGGLSVADVFMITILGGGEDWIVIIGEIDDVTVDEDQGRVDIADLTTIFADVDDDLLDYEIIGAPAPVGMQIENLSLLFMEPDMNYNLGDGAEITIIASNDEGISADVTFILVITPINDPPEVIANIADITVDEDPGRVDIVDLTEIFTDVEDDQLDYRIIGAPAEANVQIDNVILFLDPDRDYNIEDGVEIIIVAEDDEGLTVEENFILIITPINDAPIVVQEIDDVEVDQNPGLVEIADLDEVFFDIDGDVLNYDLINNVEALNLQINQNNILFVDPEEDLAFPDGADITVIAEDNAGLTAEDVFTITILPANNPIIAVAPEEIDFGNVIVGSRERIEFEVTNIGEEDLIIEDVVCENEVFWANNNDGIPEVVEGGDNMAVVVVSAELNGEQLTENDWVGVVTPNGFVAGLEQAGDAIGITIFADDPQTPAIDGFQNDEIMEFRYWIGEEGREIDAEVQFIEGNNEFQVGAFSIVQLTGFGQIDQVGLEEPIELSLGESVVLSAYFEPQERGEVEANLIIISNNGGEEGDEFDIPMRGTGMGELEPHFEFRPTADSHSIIISSASLDGEPLEEFDEIGIFTPGGLCAGAFMIGEGNNIGISAWGDDPQTQEIEGFQNGEQMNFRYWDFENEQEIEAEVDEIEIGGLVWRRDGLTILSLIAQGEPDLIEQVIELEQGWNMISLNIIPADRYWRREEGPDVILLMEQIEDQLFILKDEDGRFYIPEFGFNNIPFWDLQDACQLSVSEQCVLRIEGFPMPPDFELQLDRGWNLLAYLPDYELDASAPDFYVLSPIIDNVIIAKNARGQFMTPEFRFSNMPPWRPGQGYQVNVDEDVAFVYPPEREEELAFSGVYPLKGFEEAHLSTGTNMNVLLNDISGNNFRAGDRIIVTASDDMVVGYGTIGGDNRCGLVVWGDNEYTQEVDGLRIGEEFQLKLVNENDQHEIRVSEILYGSGLVYGKDDFTVLNAIIQPSVPEEFYLATAFPNPFNSTTTIRFGLPQGSHVSLNLFDLNGRQVKTILYQRLEPGNHTVQLSSGNIATGLYIIKMEVSDQSHFGKVMLLK